MPRLALDFENKLADVLHSLNVIIIDAVRGIYSLDRHNISQRLGGVVVRASEL